MVDIIELVQMVRVTTPHCASSKLPFGQRYAKRFQFTATGDWVRFVVRTCTCPNKKHKLLCKYYRVAGKLKFDGKSRDMSASAAYPPDLGKQLVLAWLKVDAPEPQTSSSSTAAPSWLTPPASMALPALPASTPQKRRRIDVGKTSTQPSWQQPAP